MLTHFAFVFMYFHETRYFFSLTAWGSVLVLLLRNLSYLKGLQNLLRVFGLGVRLGRQHRHCFGSDSFAWRPTACWHACIQNAGMSDGGFHSGSEFGWRQWLLSQVFHGVGVIQEGGCVWLCWMASFQDFWHFQAFKNSLADGESLYVLLKDPLCFLLGPCILICLMQLPLSPFPKGCAWEINNNKVNSSHKNCKDLGKNQGRPEGTAQGGYNIDVRAFVITNKI